MARKYHREVISEKPSPDGRGIVITEQNVRCTGSDCRHCQSKQSSRRPSKLDFNSREKMYSSVDDRLPTPYDFAFRPDPAVKQRRRDKSSTDRDRYYSNGDGYALSRSNSMQGTSMPIPIPRPSAPRRSSSMYEGGMYDNYYSHSPSRSRPAVHQDSGHYSGSGRRYSTSRQESARVPLGFYEVLESSRPSKHSSGRRRSASPLDVPQKTEDYDPERRRLRHQGKARVVQDAQAFSYGASPLGPTFEASPYGSPLRNSDFSRTASMSASPPKSVRWGDDPRLAQNQKISSRHAKKDSISSGAGTGAADNVKSILKNTDAAPAVQPLSADQYDALYQSAKSIGVEDRATTPQRQVLQERASVDDRESRDMIEGLRKRISGYAVTDDSRYPAFDMPPRRFSGAWGEKASSRGRRSERFYGDAGYY